MKKIYNILHIFTSIILILCAAFHIAFWEIFRWKETLACLSEDNRNIMYTLNIVCILIFFVMSTTSFFFKDDLVKTKFGKFISGCFASFWFLRVFLEIVLWNENPGIFIIALCAFLGMVYAIPVFTSMRFKEEKV